MKEKINSSEKMSYYLTSNKRNSYQIPYSSLDDGEYLLDKTDVESQIKCIYTIPYHKLHQIVGFPKIWEVAPGNEIVCAVEISRPNSIISIMF